MYQASYYKLLIWQYRNRPKAVETIKLLERLLGVEFIALHQLIDVLNIDLAKGRNLDLVGKHIGQSRIIDNYEIREQFGFIGAPETNGFSKEEIGGSPWYRKRDPLRNPITLDDDDYRFLIKARILKNYSKGTLSQIYDACLFLCGFPCVVIDNFDMSVSIQVPEGSLSPFKFFVINNLDILPRQAGVRVFCERVKGEL